MANVLVIDDNEADLDLLTYLLAARGHKVIQAHGGQEGIRSAMAMKPDLIFCDLRLPDVSGFDVLARLHATADLAKTPVVAVTVLGTVGDRRMVLDAGFDDHIAKPIEPAEFLVEVDGYFDLAAPPTRH